MAGVLFHDGLRAGSADRMTLRFNEICNLLIEADAIARGEKGVKRLTRRHVVAALAARAASVAQGAELGAANCGLSGEVAER